MLLQLVLGFALGGDLGAISKGNLSPHPLLCSVGLFNVHVVVSAPFLDALADALYPSVLMTATSKVSPDVTNVDHGEILHSRVRRRQEKVLRRML